MKRKDGPGVVFCRSCEGKKREGKEGIFHYYEAREGTEVVPIPQTLSMAVVRERRGRDDVGKSSEKNQ